jgi:hypothetical protein
VQRLHNPHCELHADGEFYGAQAGELAWRTVQTIGCLLPGGTPACAGGR